MFQHPRIIFNVFKVFNFSKFSGSQRLSDFQTFFLENTLIARACDRRGDPWDMLNSFCFHVYAQKSLFLGENDNVF